jgi:hypothetical protein
LGEDRIASCAIVTEIKVRRKFYEAGRILQPFSHFPGAKTGDSPNL